MGKQILNFILTEINKIYYYSISIYTYCFKIIAYQNFNTTLNSYLKNSYDFYKCLI